MLNRGGRRKRRKARRRNAGSTLIGQGVREIVYDRHATQGRGPWVHSFKRDDVEVRGRSDGRVVIGARGADVWEPDGRAGWLTNPGRKRKGAKMAKRRRRAKKGRSRRKPPKGFRSWGAYMASIRPNRARKKPRSRTMARRRRGGRRRSRRAVVVIHRGRRSRRGGRRFRRNPPAFRGLLGALMDGAKGGALVVAGKIVSRAVPALAGIQPVGILGLGVQLGAGAASWWAVDRFVGRELARPFLYGVFGAAIESFVRGLNLPIISPALGDETELHAIAGYVPGVSGYVQPGMGDPTSMGAETPMLVMG